MPTPKAGSGRDGAPIGILGAASSSFAAVPERSGTAAPPGSGEVRARHVAALIVVQLAYGGYHVISKFALQEGVDRYVFCAYRDLIAVAALFLFDLARRAVSSAGGGSSSSSSSSSTSSSSSSSSSTSSARLTSAPVPRRPLVALALVGVFLNQLLFLKGLALVGVVVAGALQLCIPVFTWILAAALGAESVSLAAREGRLKLLGATLCVLGAALATFHDGGVLIEGWGHKDAGRTTRRGMSSPGGGNRNRNRNRNRRRESSASRSPRERRIRIITPMIPPREETRSSSTHTFVGANASSGLCFCWVTARAWRPTWCFSSGSSRGTTGRTRSRGGRTR